MIIDLILDRKNGTHYNAKEFYYNVLEYENIFEFPHDISISLDYGNNTDVQKALCKYIDDNNYNAYLIKAPKKWLENNFDINGQAAGGMQITGLVKKISDFQTSREIENRLMQLDGVALPYGANCINLDYKGRAILKLVAAVLAIVVVITGLIIYKDRDDVNRTYAKIWVVGLMVTLVLLLKAIM